MVQIVVRHIGVSEVVYRDRMGKTDDLAYFLVRLQGAGMSAAAIGKGGRAADVFVLPFNGGVFLLDLQLGRPLLRPEILQFGLPPAPRPCAARSPGSARRTDAVDIPSLVPPDGSE